MDVPLREKGTYRFDRFQLDPLRRTLSRGDERIILHGRPFDTLAYLVQHHDRVVTRAELITAVWPDRVVDENNLGQAIAALRRALQGQTAEALILTVAGRGYRIGVPVEFEPYDPGLPASLQGAGEPPALKVAPPAPLHPHGIFPRWAALALLGVTLAAAAAWWMRPPAHGNRVFVAPPHSVAVLPFTNLSGDKNQDYLSDGVSEALIQLLSSTEGMRVAARFSSFTFKGAAATPAELSRRLNVGAILEGSVARAADGLKVTARLIDGQTGFAIWHGSYEAKPGGTTVPESEIAAAVSRTIGPAASAIGGVQPEAGLSPDPAAMDAYFRAMQLSSVGDAASRQHALAAADNAIARDPHFAAARVLRGMVLGEIAYMDQAADAAKMHSAGREAEDEVRRAIAIAPGLAAAHAQLANLLAEQDLDFGAALAEIELARTLAPSDAQTLMQYAFRQADAGHNSEAVAAARSAADLDPLSPRVFHELARVLLCAADYNGAAAALRQARAAEPAETGTDHLLMALTELGLGHPAGVVTCCAKLPGWWPQVYLAIAHHALGEDDAANRELAALRSVLGDTGAYQYAQIYAQWGRTQDAQHWLQTALSLRDGGLASMKSDRLLDPIANTDVFRDVVRQLKLP